MCIKIIYVRLCKTPSCVCACMHISSYIHMGGSWSRGTPKSSIYRWIFPTYKPSSYGGTLIYGTPHRCPLCEPTSQEPECGNSGWHALPTRVARHPLAMTYSSQWTWSEFLHIPHNGAQNTSQSDPHPLFWQINFKLVYHFSSHRTSQQLDAGTASDLTGQPPGEFCGSGLDANV